jgi:nucleotide-binding universal stress UspA family protein
MIRISRILCPIDFSEFSRRALDHAAALARWYESALTVLYVFPNVPAYDLPPVVLDESGRDRITREMTAFAACVGKDVSLDLRVAEAPDVHGEILRQAEAVHADLIVAGSHGRSGFERLLLGSVAERLLRKAPCPLMVVPRRATDAAATEPPRFRRILCPVDFSDGSITALTYALSLAEEADARLTMLHVIERPPELTEFPLSAGVDIFALRAAAEAEALKRLRTLVPQQAETYCTVETIVKEGSPFREILAQAGADHADVIVMGVQGRGAIDRFVFGSNTARVTRASTCPVLIVRAEHA